MLPTTFSEQGFLHRHEFAFVEQACQAVAFFFLFEGFGIIADIPEQRHIHAGVDQMMNLQRFFPFHIGRGDHHKGFAAGGLQQFPQFAFLVPPGGRTDGGPVVFFLLYES